jgi:4-hydroxythreonine-4-phosphate dehydrogenase
MTKIKVGITMGDMNGIGLEVVLKTLHHKEIQNICTPLIYSSAKVVSYHKNIVDLENFQFQSIHGVDQLYTDRVNVVNCWKDSVNITLGKASEEGGKYALESIKRAVSDLKDGHIDALITAPIHKQAMQMAGFPFPGHTEYLTTETGTPESLMLMVSEQMRIGLATNHLPIAEVAGSITKELILKKIQLLNESLKMDFGIERPTIAVLGLNPHAGDGGVIGSEEETIIRPAVVESKKRGVMVVGPFPADGFFGSSQHRKFDGILAMYHDQGLIPFKALSFGDGINYTAGLPVVRTSPDHGTAYDIAGRNVADPSSFRQALYLAVDICRNRKLHQEISEGRKAKREQVSEEPEGDA